ncbi:uncharacterized protein ARMOST_18567 [Armillaria ostoyae]|uniref:Uncharacterized protein n=1 Tax=Armillaria ostoyae TaxID=47428 RepID=A0A284S269_ARMOS|nr:uncharacterized protein ARMOST_18567 [Armillaria ostoyae]
MRDLLRALPRDLLQALAPDLLPDVRTQDLELRTCAQNAFLISSSCKFPKAEKPETHLALLKILCCSGRYAFTFTDPRSQPEIFFTNAIQCFLSNQSEPAHLQHELDVVERILGPFFNQEYITDRDHTLVRFLGPFELKDRVILLKIFGEEGGLQALDRKFEAMLERSAMPEELAPTTDFAHLVANQMIKTNAFNPLHLPDYAPKSPFTDNLSVLIHLLLYNSSGRLMIDRLLKILHQGNMAHLMWKEFVKQLRQWVANEWEDLGRPYNIGDIHRVPDLLLEDVPADPQSTV